ncbi:hypothetical protein OBBRIDRAFT_712044, partial [Obba rivulosa]
HVLSQYSYLDYGLTQARLSVHRLVEFMGTMRSTPSGPDAKIGNPCLATDTSRLAEIDNER